MRILKCYVLYEILSLPNINPDSFNKYKQKPFSFTFPLRTFFSLQNAFSTEKSSCKKPLEELPKQVKKEVFSSGQGLYKDGLATNFHDSAVRSREDGRHWEGRRS